MKRKKAILYILASEWPHEDERKSLIEGEIVRLRHWCFSKRMEILSIYSSYVRIGSESEVFGKILSEIKNDNDPNVEHYFVVTSFDIHCGKHTGFVDFEKLDRTPSIVSCPPDARFIDPGIMHMVSQIRWLKGKLNRRH